MDVLVKIKASKVLENGKVAKVIDQYLFTGILSFMEAENEAIKELQCYYEEFSIDNIVKKNFTEVVTAQDCGRYYTAKIAMVTFDDKTGCEKRTAFNVLIEAEDFSSTVKAIENHMKNSMCDYEIVSISESKILDVYEYGSIKN